MENCNEKAVYVYYCEQYLEDEEKEKIKNISDLSDHVTHYKYGDLVAFSEYRDTETYIIGKKGKLIPNPDNASAGYLSIPYQITQYLDDAVSMYGHSDLCVNDIDLRYNDKFILNNINTKKCKILKKWNWKLSWCVDYLYVKFPNGKSNDFDISDTNSEKILAWYKGSEKEYYKFKIDYQVKNDKYDNWIKKHGEENYKWLSVGPKIPDDWSVQKGGGSGGTRYHQSVYYFEGPLESKDSVRDTVEKFYQDTDFKITEIN